MNLYIWIYNVLSISSVENVLGYFDIKVDVNFINVFSKYQLILVWVLEFLVHLNGHRFLLWKMAQEKLITLFVMD